MPIRDSFRKVTVRVWPRQANSSSPATWVSTGHSALMTYVGGDTGGDYYVSFWPKNCCNKSYDPSGIPSKGTRQTIASLWRGLRKWAM